MTREIKFRVWDKKDKKYLLPEKQGFVILPTSPSFGVTIPYENRSNPGNMDEECIDWADADLLMERYELEQHTGLKDKNGKEIYEGDIVQIAGERASIVFDKELASYMGRFLVGGLDQIIEFNDYIHAFCPHDIEVIGNIHENGELLEKG